MERVRLRGGLAPDRPERAVARHGGHRMAADRGLPWRGERRPSGAGGEGLVQQSPMRMSGRTAADGVSPPSCRINFPVYNRLHLY